MSKKFSRAQLRKIIIAEMKDLAGGHLLNEGLVSMINVAGSSGPPIGSETLLRKLGQKLLSSDADDIADAWASIMKHYVGPFMTIIKRQQQNSRFYLIDFIMGGYVPITAGSRLIGYHPWLPYGQHNKWPFKPASVIYEALGDEYSEEELVGVGAGYDDIDQIIKDRQAARLAEPDTGQADSDTGEPEIIAGEESGQIPILNKGQISSYNYLPGVMMPWLSRRAREDILFSSCLYDEGVSAEQRDQGGWGDCQYWSKKAGFGNSLAREMVSGTRIPFPDVLGGDLQTDSSFKWTHDLISDGEARENVLVSMKVLVNKFLSDYGPWETYYRYTDGDFEATTDTQGWSTGDIEIPLIGTIEDTSDAPTAVSCWMKSDSMFKNHDDD